MIACLTRSDSPHSLLSSTYQDYNQNLAATASLLKNETLHLSKRCVISALLTLDLHNRDVIGALISSKVTSPMDFEWTRWVYLLWIVLAIVLALY